MARGGYRPGAGRPKTKSAVKPAKDIPPDIRREALAEKMTPLEYMLDVMNSNADEARRDRMAIAAAPYVHERASDRAAGKKEAAEEAAKSAGVGSAWGDDLLGPAAKPN